MCTRFKRTFKLPGPSVFETNIPKGLLLSVSLHAVNIFGSVEVSIDAPAVPIRSKINEDPSFLDDFQNISRVHAFQTNISYIFQFFRPKAKLFSGD